MGGSNTGLMGKNPLSTSLKTRGPTGTNRDCADPSTRHGTLGNTPGAIGLNDYADPNVNKPVSSGRLSFGLPRLQLELDPELKKIMLQQTVFNHDLFPLWDFLMEHGKIIFSLPFDAPKEVLKIRNRSVRMADPPSRPGLIFEIPPLDDALIRASKSVTKFASTLGLDTLSLRGSRLWIVYENDGSLPFNPGSGSDQGPTAFLGIYVTFDAKRKGLTRLGWTVIDMQTPRPTLPVGSPFDSSSRYETPSGPYSGKSAIDFTVTMQRTGTVKVDILGAVGVDSTRWGKFVQDFIHQQVSNSPLFPWPKNKEKLFAEAGVAVLVTPQKALNEGNWQSISYQGKIEFGGKLKAGTHSSEATADARYVVRTTSVETPLGTLNAEYSPLGIFGRGFLRYNDGRQTDFAGVEGGFKASAMVNIGRLGIGLTGEITISTDRALRTDNPAGSRPLISPLSEPLGSSERLGGPAGHHGKGQLVLTWSF